MDPSPSLPYEQGRVLRAARFNPYYFEYLDIMMAWFRLIPTAPEELNITYNVAALRLAMVMVCILFLP